jgi:hypothetical protein
VGVLTTHSFSLVFSTMGACFAAWSQGVLFGKTITRLKAGPAASAARIIATVKNSSMRLTMRYLPLLVG